MAESARVKPRVHTKDELDEDSLIAMRRWVKTKKVGLNPQSKDYVGLNTFDLYIEERLREIAWQKFKAEKGI